MLLMIKKNAHYKDCYKKYYVHNENNSQQFSTTTKHEKEEGKFELNWRSMSYFEYILNGDIRGLFVCSSCPSWPLSLLPHENTFPSEVRNNVCQRPQLTCIIHELGGLQFILRGVRICHLKFKLIL